MMLGTVTFLEERPLAVIGLELDVVGGGGGGSGSMVCVCVCVCVCACIRSFRGRGTEPTYSGKGQTVPVWLSYLASVYTAGVAGRLWIQLNMALTACPLLYGVDEMVVLHTLSLSLFIPKGKASVLGVWTVLGRKAESLPVCPTVSIFYQMREQGSRGTRILVQPLSVGTGICGSLILSAWKSPGAAGEFLPGDEVQKRLSFLKWSPHQALLEV